MSSLRDRNADNAALLEQADSAHAAGRLPEAELLYRRLLAVDPDELLALVPLAFLVRERGDIVNSNSLFERAAAVSPDDAELLTQLGVGQMTAGDLPGAERSFRGALGLCPDSTSALAALGALLQSRGHIGQSIRTHRRVLDLDPTNIEAQCNLIKALSESGAGEQALHEAESAMQRFDGHPFVAATQGAVLIDLERFGAAVPLLERAVETHPADEIASINLAFAQVQIGEATRAADTLREALVANPANARATADLAAVLNASGQYAAALELCGHYLARYPGERLVLAAYAYILREAGRSREADAIMDFDNLLRVVDLDSIDGFEDVDKFDVALAEVIDNDASSVEDPVSKATRGGLQTGEFDLRAGPALAAFESTVVRHVDAFARDLHHGGFTDHPAMAYEAPGRTVRAWGTVLESAGRQAPHMHPGGWFSGVYYVRVPDDMHGEESPGCLEFGAPPERYFLQANPSIRLVEPRDGRLVIFPSYFYHRTRPFVSARRRISIAFDVVPLAR